MRYTVSLSGNGAVCSLLSVSDEQIDELIEMGIEDENLGFEEVCAFLGIEDPFLKNNNIIVGVHYSQHHISVKNESGVEVWNSNGSEYYFHECKRLDVGLHTSYLVVEKSSDGEFFKFNFESNEVFNPKKLTPILYELAQVKELMYGFIYDGRDISLSKQYLNYLESDKYCFTLYRKNY